MKQQGPGWFAQCMLGPLAYPEYRRLLLRSYVLLTRARLLYAAVTVIEPFVTPGLLRIIKRWHLGLKADVAAFSVALRERNIVKWAPVATPAPPTRPPEYQNPWV